MTRLKVRRAPDEPRSAFLALAGRWREEALRLRDLGAVGQAMTLEACAGSLEALSREEAERTVTLKEAETITGYSYSALQKMTVGGRITNVGTKHRPRLRVGDLPRKTCRTSAGTAPELAARILEGSP